MKTFAAITLAGVTGLVVLKLLASLVVPLLGLFVGLVVLAIKLAIVVAVGAFVYSMIRRSGSRAAA